MSSVYGDNITLSIFGQSHSPAIGMTLDGIPAGKKINKEELYAFLARRAPGGELSTARKESDLPEFLGGILPGGDDSDIMTTCGAPITAVIHNKDTRSGDYANLDSVPRPGHADYTAKIKYGGCHDQAGGGHFSGRLTAPLCIAGGICLQLLGKEGIEIFARIASVGDISDSGDIDGSVAGKPFPVVDDGRGEQMKKLILECKAAGDSVGGVIECAVCGLPAGLGDPMFGGMENRIAGIVFGIPAVKGIEFGAGFAASRMKGSECNDPFRVSDGKITTETNNCGGILGGITDGMPLVFRAAFKPTPSIALPQKSVDLTGMTDTVLTIKGRHDPCIVPRAVPCIEAAAAVAVYDAYLSRKKELL